MTNIPARVVSGCAVTATGTPDTDVHVAAGLQAATSLRPVSGTALTPATAETETDRQDAVVTDPATGTASVITGPVNDGINVQPPDTTGYTVLAYVYILNQGQPDYTGTITDDAIIDQRVIVDGTFAAAASGATAESRYVGATTSGAPASGTFEKGDFAVDQTGSFWICTTAGTPGTWTNIT